MKNNGKKRKRRRQRISGGREIKNRRSARADSN